MIYIAIREFDARFVKYLVEKPSLLFFVVHTSQCTGMAMTLNWLLWDAETRG